MSEKVLCNICGFIKSKSRLESHQQNCFPRYCVHCNKQLFGKDKRIKFCSIECYTESIKNSKPKKYCIVCGKEIVTTDYRKKFCNRSCSAKMSNKSENRDRKVSNKKTSETLKRFYSDEKNLERVEEIKKACKSEEAREKTKKTKNLRYENLQSTDSVGYSAIKSFLMRKFNHTCSGCGLSEWNNKPIPLELHHIDGNSFNNSKENCVLLCSNCHAQTEGYCRNTHAKIRHSDEYIAEVLRGSSNINRAVTTLGITPRGDIYNKMHRIIKAFKIKHLAEKYKIKL